MFAFDYAVLATTGSPVATKGYAARLTHTERAEALRSLLLVKDYNREGQGRSARP